MHPKSVSDDLKYIFTFGHTNPSYLCKQTFFPLICNESHSTRNRFRTCSLAFLMHGTTAQTSAAPRTYSISCRRWGCARITVTPEDVSRAIADSQFVRHLPLPSLALQISGFGGLGKEIRARSPSSSLLKENFRTTCFRPRVSSWYECLWTPHVRFRSQ